MNRQIVFATTNANKLVEIRSIMKDLGIEIISLKDAGINIDIDENGKTFEDNALIKAKTISKICGKIVMADDSGLEIDYLNKEPGVHSARFAGVNTPYSVKNKLIIEKLAGVEESRRTARFVCVIATVFPDGNTITTKGTIEGYIGYEERGKNGFGYDPIFYLKENGRTTAELSMEEKNLISHRGKALELMKHKLIVVFGGE